MLAKAFIVISMWIARLSNGDSITENKWTSKGKSFEDINKRDIQSLQILFYGIYFTVTRANDSQFLVQEKAGRGNILLKNRMLKNKETGEEIKVEIPQDIPLEEQIIYCVYNSNGDAMGWAVNYRTMGFNQIKFNITKVYHGVRGPLSLEKHGIELEGIRLQLPILKGKVLR